MMISGKTPLYYYPGMHRDGYSPTEILFAAHNTMYRDYLAREAAREDALPSNVKISVETKQK